MIDKTNMQGVMNVIRQAELANSKLNASSLAIGNEQPQSQFASDLLAAIRSVNDTQMKAADTKAQYEVNGAISVTERQAYILRVRELAKGSAAAWLKSQGVEAE